MPWQCKACTGAANQAHQRVQTHPADHADANLSATLTHYMNKLAGRLTPGVTRGVQRAACEQHSDEMPPQILHAVQQSHVRVACQWQCTQQLGRCVSHTPVTGHFQRRCVWWSTLCNNAFLLRGIPWSHLCAAVKRWTQSTSKLLEKGHMRGATHQQAV
jgi:hypothetical protein